MSNEIEQKPVSRKWNLTGLARLTQTDYSSQNLQINSGSFCNAAVSGEKAPGNAVQASPRMAGRFRGNEKTLTIKRNLAVEALDANPYRINGSRRVEPLGVLALWNRGIALREGLAA